MSFEGSLFAVVTTLIVIGIACSFYAMSMEGILA